MLRKDKGSADRPWSRAGRFWAAVLLSTVAAAVELVRGPARGDGLDALPGAAEITKNPSTPAKPAKTPAFDLSDLPDKVQGFVAFRPAAGFQRSGMARYLAPINAEIARLYEKGARSMGLPPRKCPLRIEQIGQVAADISTNYKELNGKKQQRIMSGSFMVRTVEPFDWQKEIRAWWPKLAEVRVAGHVFSKMQGCPAPPGKDACVYFPDDRTIVLDVGENLVRLFDRKGPPEFVRTMHWEQTAGLLALALDNRDGRLVPSPAQGEAADPVLTPLFQHAQGWLVRIADDDQFACRAIARCIDATAREATALAAEDQLRHLSQDVIGDEKSSPVDKETFRVLKALVSNLRVARDGSSVSVFTTNAPQLADVFRAFMEMEDPDVEVRPEPGKAR